mgnify:FL=1
MKKSDEQWCRDNGVPPDAKYNHLHGGHDAIKLVNAMLRPHGLRVRTKQRRNHGNGSYVWVEPIPQT